MRFADPYFLLLLLALPLLAWWRGKGAPSQPAFLYSSIQLVRGISGIRRSHAGRILARLRWLALALLIIGLARPQLTEGRATVRASGIDIIIALDLSQSMAAEDFELNNRRTNRLGMARQVVAEFITERPSDRIGIVAFAGNAYIAAPLTLDHRYLLQNLHRLDFGLIEDGTAIGSALAASANRLREVDSKSKIIILMTDGQNNSGDIPPLTAAEAAQALQIKVYTIGVGTHGTAPFPVKNVFGQTVYRQEPVDIDEETLQAIADRTGGRYYRADRADTLRRIYSEIDQLEKSEATMDQYQRYQELFPWLVLPGLVLVLLEVILSQTVWRRLP